MKTRNPKASRLVRSPLRFGLLLLLSLSGPLAPAGAGDLPTLFSAPPPGAPARLAPRASPSASPAVPIDVDFQLLVSETLLPGTLIRCEPEPGVLFTARVSRILRDVNGTVTLMAPLLDSEFGFLSVSVSEGLALGEVRLPDRQRRYLIRFESSLDQHVAEDLADDEIDELPSGPAIVPPPPDDDGSGASVRRTSAPADPVPPDLQGTDANTVIDLLIVYTPAAATWAASSGGGINNVIAQAMARAQASMDNSLIPVTFRLVHSAQITYTESGNSNTDLSRLQQTADGYMDEVHTWRNTYGADVVCLLTTTSDTGGLGYALTSPFLPGGFPHYAFSISRVQQTANTYTMIHEIGHNMGAGHHKLQNVQAGPQLYSYSAGWRWTGTNASRYCSVMTYEQGTYFADNLTHTRVGHFSSPDVSYQGVATGHAADGDNARTLRATAALTAAYRSAINKPFWLRATPLDNRVMLRWEDPLENGFSSKTVLIRCATNTYPASTNQGSFVYQGTARQFLHTNPIPRVAHYYTIWLSNDGSTFVEPNP